MSKTKRIRGLLLFLLLSQILVWVFSVGASNNTSVELSSDEKKKIFERLQILQKEVHSLHASVRQTKQLAALKKRVDIEGKVSLLKPNLLRWEVSKPERSVTVVDGEMMTVYHPDLKEAQVYALSEHLIARNTMSFFTTAMGSSLLEMEKTFSVSVFRDADGIAFRLEPHSKMAQKYLSHIVIYYDEGTGLPKSFEVVTPKGDKTVTRLTDIKTNPELGPETFKLRLPKDTWVTNQLEPDNR